MQELHLLLGQAGVWDASTHAALARLAGPAGTCVVRLRVAFGGRLLVHELQGINLVALSLESDCTVIPRYGVALCPLPAFGPHHSSLIACYLSCCFYCCWLLLAKEGGGEA